MSDRISVLIVGAGPCGMAAACQLLRLGVPVRIVDAAPTVGDGSRAIMLWPPALEVLDEVGTLTGAREQGVRARAMTYHMDGSKGLRVELGESNAPLLLPQERTARLLDGRLRELGGSVEWSTRVTDLTQDADSVTVTLQKPDGAEETVRADWVIGADGVGSTVRQRLGVEFAGDRIATTFLLAEGQVEGSFERSEVHYFLGSAGVILLAPLPDGVVRISGPVAEETVLTTETVQQLLDERGPGGLRVADLSWLGTFTSQERIAVSFRQGRCFLVGDAAHVHSVVGGQGLNLGLQDVRNLTWKLAGVIDGRFQSAILDTYTPERRAVAEQTVKATSRMARQAVAGPVGRRFRNAAWALLQRSGALTKVYAPMLAGWRSRYPDVLFGAGRAAPRTRSLPQPGTRTPAWVLAASPATSSPAPSSSDVAAPVDTRLRLVTLGPTGGELVGEGRSLAARYPELVGHEHLPRPKAGFLLVRPDGYVAASGRSSSELTGLVPLLAALAAEPATVPAQAAAPAAQAAVVAAAPSDAETSGTR